jgi:hypothetical protein
MPNQYDGIAITKQLLFGTADVPVDFNERVRAEDAPSPVFNVDSDTYLTTGAGRYGWPSRANLVEKFFANSANLPAGDYTSAQLVTALGMIGVTANLGTDILIPINNYRLDRFSDDWIERAYIFGDGNAKLEAATFHIAVDDTATISDVIVQPIDDNFDFTSDSPTAQLFNDNLLKPILDPDVLGIPAVTIDFSPASARIFDGDGIYTRAMFDADEAKEVALTGTIQGSLLVNAFAGSDYLNAY